MIRGGGWGRQLIKDNASMTDTLSRMTPLELRSSFSLASIYALRMLGLFLVLPVFALEAAHYPGGDDAVAVGLAMGIYGLTQGVLQIPFGIASDRWGRKRVLMGALAGMGAACLLGALLPQFWVFAAVMVAQVMRMPCGCATEPWPWWPARWRVAAPSASPQRSASPRLPGWPK
jgi:MFS family permease